MNVCTSDVLPAPEDITEEELIKILESDQPSDFRVPMSIGAPHKEKDKCELCVCEIYTSCFMPYILFILQQISWKG